LMRNETKAEVNVSTFVSAGAMKPWIKIEPQPLVFKPGMDKVMLGIRISIPKNASPGYYRGKINIVLGNVKSTGQVGIMLGSLLDLNLNVVK
jgi:hypothetical protein